MIRVLGKYLSLESLHAFLPVKLNKKKEVIVVQSSFEHVVGCLFCLTFITKAELEIAFKQ